MKKKVNTFFNKENTIIKLVVIFIITIITITLFIFFDATVHISNGFHKIMRNNGFSVQELSLSGRKNANSKIILETTDIKSGVSIFRVNVDEVKVNLEKIGWIETATVERRFPNSIHITIKERHPIAIWQGNGKHSLIDQYGNIITKKNISKFSYLKVLVGKGANKKVIDFLRLIAKDPTLAKITTAGVYVSKRRWNIVLLDKITVKLPAYNPTNSWLTLGTYAREKKLLARPIEVIDMRVPKKIFLKMKKNTS